MSEHPIEGLMTTAMNSIQDMIDVDTIIGDPIQTANNVVIIPISKVSFGFAAGGSEFKGETINEYSRKDKDEEIQYRLPFGGGSGAGVSINPIAFLIIQEERVRLLPVSHASTIDKLIDYVPDIIEKANNILENKICKKSIKDVLEETKISDNEKGETEIVKTKTSKRKVVDKDDENIYTNDKEDV